MSVPLFQIRLLGPVALIYDRKPVHIQRKMARAILYMLAAEKKSLSRTQLIDLLWPNGETADPRATLRTMLSRLRSELPDPDMVTTRLDQISLAEEHCQVDVRIFETMVEDLKERLPVYAEVSPLPAALVLRIEQALSLWHGENLIEGDDLSSYPEVNLWRLMLNQQLRNHRKFLQIRLAQHHRAEGKLEKALDTLLKIGRKDALEIQVQIEILKLYSQLGRYREAVDYGDSLEALFEKHYNAPLPDALLEHCQYARVLLKEGSRKTMEWPYPQNITLRFVGRQDELALLREAHARGGIVHLHGESGAGKTRIVQELFCSLAPKPYLFVAEAHEMEQSLPLAPIINGLRQNISEEIWLQLDSVWMEELLVVLPELAYLRADSSQPWQMRAHKGQQQLFEALAQLFHLVSRQNGRLLFFLDNAQWADNLSLQAISYLISKGIFDQEGLLILASVEKEFFRDGTELLKLQSRKQPIQSIALAGLDKITLKGLVEQLLPESPSDRLMERLMSETNGNPFFAIEIVHALLDDSTEDAHLNIREKLPLPQSVQAVISKRLSILNDDERHLLACAAVLGGSSNSQHLVKISGLPEEVARQALDRLILSGFLRIAPVDFAQKPMVRFLHGKLREVVLIHTPPIQSQILHQRVAECLAETSEASTKATLIANHFLAAGDSRAAFEWFLRAGDYAWRLSAREDAHQAYNQAERQFVNAPAGFFTIDDILELYQQWAIFAYQSNQITLLEDIGIKLQYFGEREASSLLSGVARATLADACFLRNEFQAGMVFIQEALEHLSRNGATQPLIRALIRQGALNWWLLDYPAALGSFQEALAYLEKEPRSTSTSGLIFTARFMMGTTHYAIGDGYQAVAIGQALFEEQYHYLDPFDKIRSQLLLAYGKLMTGSYRASREACLSALEINQTEENTFIQELLLTTIAKAEVELGYLDAAYEHAQRALLLGEENHHRDAVVMANMILGDIHFNLKRYAAANHYYQIARLRNGISQTTYNGLENNLRIGYLYIRWGQLAKARKLLAETLRLTETYGIQQLSSQAHLIEGLCDLQDGNLSAAEERFGHAEEIASQYGLAGDRLWSHLLQAQLHRAREQFELAQKSLLSIVQQSQALGAVWPALQAIASIEQIASIQKQPVDVVETDRVKKRLIDHLEAYSSSGHLQRDFSFARKDWESS